MHRRLSRRTLLPAAAVLAALSGCIDATGPVIPAQLAIAGGDAQTGVVGAELPQPVAVRVTNIFGNPLPNAAVSFQVTAGGGSLTAPTASTDADGVARTGWRLGPTAGAVQRVEASVTGTQGPITVALVAVGAADVPAGIEFAGSSVPFSAPLGQVIGSYTAIVEDRFGNRVAGASVTWTPGGGGTATPAAGVTNVDGVTTTTWTAGLRDTAQTLRASTGAVSTGLLFINAITYHDATVEVVSGGGQTGVVGQPLAQPVVVRVQLPDGRPLQGVLVQTATAYGGAITPFHTRTPADGTATLQWTLGPTAGAQVLQAQLVVGSAEQFVRYVDATAQP